MISHILEGPHSTLNEQLSLLGSISNYHWWDYKTAQGVTKSKSTQPRFTQHLLYHPGIQRTNKTGGYYCQQIPTSPRNQLMYFCLGNNSERFHSTVRHLLDYDRKGEQGREPIVSLPDPPVDEGEPTEPARKKRKTAARVLSVSPQTLFDTMNQNFQDVLNSGNLDTTLFMKFHRQLSGTDGTILWRKHSEESDVVIMSDYSLTTGVLLPQEFVHVTAFSDEGCLYTQCTCKAYDRMHNIASLGEDLAEGEVSALSPNSTCMHCRFYQEYLQGAFGGNLEENTHLFSKFSSTLDQMANPLVLLGEANPSVSKFSVFGDGTYSVISVLLNPNGTRQAGCSQGTCSNNLKNKKTIPKTVSLDQLEHHVCCHLNTFFANFEFVRECLPFLGEEEDQGDSNSVSPAVEVNSQDAGILGCNPTTNVYFCQQTKLWQNHSTSKHKPRGEFDPHLVNCRRSRLTFPDFNQVLDGGFFTGPDLIPHCRTPDGEPRPCGCGVSRNARAHINRAHTVAIWQPENNLPNNISIGNSKSTVWCRFGNRTLSICQMRVQSDITSTQSGTFPNFRHFKIGRAIGHVAVQSAIKFVNLP